MQPDEDSTPALLALLREDYRANSPRPWASPGFHALVVHRFGTWTDDVRGPLRTPLRAVYLALWRIVSAVYGIELSPVLRVGRRFVIGHQGGIVVGASKIGDDCLIRQNVTIGVKVAGGVRPTLGDRVEVGAGAVVIGDVTIGDGVKIGPNAVVTQSVPPGSVVLAPAPEIVTPKPKPSG